MRANDYGSGVNLVLEVVSPDDLDKRLEYTQAGIPEYWIVNPNQSA